MVRKKFCSSCNRHKTSRFKTDPQTQASVCGSCYVSSLRYLKKQHILSCIEGMVGEFNIVFRAAKEITCHYVVFSAMQEVTCFLCESILTKQQTKKCSVCNPGLTGTNECGLCQLKTVINKELKIKYLYFFYSRLGQNKKC